MAGKKNSGKHQIPVKDTNFFVFSNFKLQSLVLFIIGFVFYANSFVNEYALDDGIVILGNDYVQQGFHGIPKILSTDAFDSYYRQMGVKQQISGGRYRPLSVVTFAIEQQLFGSKAKDKPANDLAMLRHVLNVLFYIFSVIILLYFLRTFIFKEQPLIAFFTCLIFLIHPLHTEVVANIKSRDEIFSFLFIILTFIAVLRYRETKKVADLFYGLLFYFLAFLSKEYAITLVILIPMLLYVVKGDSLTDSIMKTIPFFFVAAIYLLIRFSIVKLGGAGGNTEVLNNPYLYATKPEKWATKIEILNHYLRLLFYPHPLSSDYSYNTIPYTNFKNGLVWMSILIHLSMIVVMIKLFFQRNILAFALAFYLLHLALISNFLMDVGATMGERLVYHSSFGFAIIIAVSANWIFEKIGTKEHPSTPLRVQNKTKQIVAIMVFSLITCWCAAKVIERNAEWKTDATLFIADAQTVPNSVLVNGNAGKAYINLSEKPENKNQEKELLQKAILHLNRSVSIHNLYVNGYLNLGVAYAKLRDFDKAKAYWDIVNQIYPGHPMVKTNFIVLASEYYNSAASASSTNPKEAIKFLEKAVEIDSTNTNYWYSLGRICYGIEDFEKARNAWTKTLQLNPGYEEAKKALQTLPVK